MKTTIAAGVGSVMEYKSEPVLANLANGNILCVYRRGSSHISNDGKLVGKISADLGESWGTEFDILDDPLYDTRNPSVGVDPVSGRVVVFGRRYNATTGTQIDVFYMYSDDNAATFTAPASLAATLAAVMPGQIAPYGPMVKTSLGLLQGFYATNKWALLVSTDGGQTWPTPIVVYSTSSYSLGEPVMVDLGDDRLIALVRSETNRAAHGAYRSMDGGATWVQNKSGSTFLYPWTSSPVAIDAAGPMWANKLPSGRVSITWYQRYQQNKLVNTQCTDELFWNETGQAWLNGGAAYPTQPRQVLAPGYARHNAITSADPRDSGYACPLLLPDGRELVAWYDTGDGTDTNTSIYCMVV